MNARAKRMLGLALIVIAALITITQVLVPALAPGMAVVAALALRPVPQPAPVAVIDLTDGELLQHLLVNC